MARPAWHVEGLNLLRNALPNLGSPAMFEASGASATKMLEIDGEGHEVTLEKISYTASGSYPLIKYTIILEDKLWGGQTVLTVWVHRPSTSSAAANRAAVAQCITALLGQGATYEQAQANAT